MSLRGKISHKSVNKPKIIVCFSLVDSFLQYCLFQVFIFNFIIIMFWCDYLNVSIKGI